jgi:ABC-type Fe3+-hydroxamate transport system substrate-binding protein
MATFNPPADHWDFVGHYYAPIPHYDGKVLKYQGEATKGNLDAILRVKYPDGVLLSEYKGDRIYADTHEDYNK